jgi:hypothetical protein
LQQHYGNKRKKHKNGSFPIDYQSQIDTIMMHTVYASLNQIYTNMQSNFNATFKRQPSTFKLIDYGKQKLLSIQVISNVFAAQRNVHERHHITKFRLDITQCNQY